MEVEEAKDTTLRLIGKYPPSRRDKMAAAAYTCIEQNLERIRGEEADHTVRAIYDLTRFAAFVLTTDKDDTEVIAQLSDIIKAAGCLVDAYKVATATATNKSYKDLFTK